MKRNGVNGGVTRSTIAPGELPPADRKKGLLIAGVSLITQACRYRDIHVHLHAHFSFENRLLWVSYIVLLCLKYLLFCLSQHLLE